MSRIPAQGVVVAVGAVSIFASLCLVGGPAAWSSIDTTSHPLSNAAVIAPLSTTSLSAQAAYGVSNAQTLATATGGVFGIVPAAAVTTASPADESAAVVTPVEPTPAVTVPAVTAPVVAAPVLPVVKAVVPKPVVAKPAIVAKAASVLTPRAIAQSLAATHGWTGAQWVCLDKLWQHESKYETTVRNMHSGAYGIPQALPASKMATAGADWRTNPVTQVKWGLSYISARYGTPCGAWQHELYDGSY
jgi:hypothetical protein